MSYKTGFCCDCDCQIMIQDIHGVYNSVKPNYRQIDLIYENGPKFRVHACADCLDHIDLQKIHDAVTSEDSQAQIPQIKEYFKNLGAPTQWQEYNGLKGAVFPRE